MLYGFKSNQDEEVQEFHQRVADRNIQSIEDRQEEIQRAKNSFLGILSGIVIGALVGWMFFGPAETENKEKSEESEKSQESQKSEKSSSNSTSKISSTSS